MKFSDLIPCSCGKLVTPNIYEKHQNTMRHKYELNRKQPFRGQPKKPLKKTGL